MIPKVLPLRHSWRKLPINCSLALFVEMQRMNLPQPQLPLSWGLIGALRREITRHVQGGRCHFPGENLLALVEVGMSEVRAWGG